MWEYVKGSEENFEGAPEWANFVIVGGEFKGFWFLDDFDDTSEQKHCRSDLVRVTYKGLDYGKEVYTIIAERRKVDNLQETIKPNSPADRFLQQAFDTIQRPAHYNQSGIECIDAIAASMSAEEFQAYLKGNVQKYLWRYQHKNGVEDVRKAHWYLERLVKELRK